MKKNVNFYLIISLFFGLFYSLSTYQNSMSVMYPILNMVTVIGIVLMNGKNKTPLKKSSYFYLSISMAMAILDFRTANHMIHIVLNMSVFLLNIATLLNQRFNVSKWGVLEYMEGGVCTVFESVVNSVSIFPDLLQHKRGGRKNVENHSEAGQEGDEKNRKKKNTWVFILIGASLAFPVLLIVTLLLMSADVVFQKMVISLFRLDLIHIDVVAFIVLAFLGTLAFYGFLKAMTKVKVSGNVYKRNHGEPVIAITFTGVFAFIYVIFSTIQVVYLFLGGINQLPEGFTYAEYARRGFFELLFVALLNYGIVYFCTAIFKESKALKILLTVISGCTYILIASSAYRMAMYVDVYHMTFLRILVLWFLIVLALWITGGIVSIYHREWNLFLYTLCVTMVMFIGFTLLKPDAFIARYNITNKENITLEDVDFLTSELSVDAAPYIQRIDLEKCAAQERNRIESTIYTYYQDIHNEHNASIRKFNVSRWRAYRASKEFLEKAK